MALANCRSQLSQHNGAQAATFCASANRAGQAGSKVIVMTLSLFCTMALSLVRSIDLVKRKEVIVNTLSFLWEN